MNAADGVQHHHSQAQGRYRCRQAECEEEPAPELGEPGSQGHHKRRAEPERGEESARARRASAAEEAEELLGAVHRHREAKDSSQQ